MTHETTTGERTVVLPEVSIDVTTSDKIKRARKLMRKLEPKLAELHELALQVRAENDRALLALSKVLDPRADATRELAEKVTGWGALWNEVTSLGEAYGLSAEELDIDGWGPGELERGGERNFPVGTEADVNDPQGNVVRVKVLHQPKYGGLAGDGYLVFSPATGKEYVATHEDIRTGLVTNGG